MRTSIRTLLSTRSKKSSPHTLVYCVAAALACCAGQTASADTGMGIRAGTMGFGVDVDFAMTDKLNLRVGYNYLSYDRSVSDTDAEYDGTIKIGSISGLLDWHAFGGGFRVSVGAVGSGPKIDVVGRPTSGTYTIGGQTYNASDIGSVRGEVKIGNSVAPYIGIGYGNVVDARHRISFLFDVGAIYGGKPDVSLTAYCNPSVPAAACSQAQLDSNVQAEIRDLENNVNNIEWYPVVNVGIGIRF